MSSGLRFEMGGSGGPAVTWRPGGPIWSAALGEEGAGLQSSPSRVGWAGVQQCVRLCGLASAGGNSSLGLHLGAGRVGLGFFGCVRGGCAGHWEGWVCRGASGSLWSVCEGCRVWGVVRGVQRVGPWRAWAVVLAGGRGSCRGARGRARWWACVGLQVDSGGGEGQGRGLRGGLCCDGVCVRLQRRAWVVSCRPGGLEEKLAVFCGRGKDFTDKHAHLVHLLVSGGKRVC